MSTRRLSLVRARSWPIVLALIGLLCSVHTSTASAADLEEPCTGSHDWVQLKSAEWLKGDLRRMRARYVKFWSREMKTHRFKWSKVVVLCVNQDARFITEGHAVFIGRGVVRGESIEVDTEEGKIRFPRDELMAILPGRARELDRWGILIGLGVDANVGNTDQTALNASVAIRREDRFTRGEIEYSGSFGTADGRENINRHRIDGKLDWFLTRRLYWSILDVPAVYDKFQNIALRLSPSTGPGWQIFDTGDFEWAVEAGVGYQYTSFISVEPFQDKRSSDAVIRFSTNFKWDIINNLDLKVDHVTLIVATDIGLTTLYTRAALKYELTWLLKLETAVIHNRIWDPVARADGTQPESDDVQLIIGFALETN